MPDCRVEDYPLFDMIKTLMRNIDCKKYLFLVPYKTPGVNYAVVKTVYNKDSHNYEKLILINKK